MSTETEPITLSAEVPFFLSKNNEIFGPHLVGEIQGLLDEDIISPDDLIWMEGWPEWLSLRSVFELDLPEAKFEEEPEADMPEEEVPLTEATSSSAVETTPTASAMEAFSAPVAEPTPALAVPVEPISAPAPEVREYEEEARVARIIADRSTRRMQIGIVLAVLAHLLIFALVSLIAPSIFKIEAYPAIAAPSAPPPLEVALVPEEEPPPPVPTPPQETAPPPPPLEPPPPPAPPIIPMPTPPPPPMPALNALPTPPPMADLPIAPTPPQHLPTKPKRATVKANQAPVAPEAPTNQVTDAGPSDYLYAPQPDYPFASQKRHEGGTVLLRVIVSAEGNPTAVTIERSSGYRTLDQSALTTVRDSYRFRVGNSRILLVPISFRPR